MPNGKSFPMVIERGTIWGNFNIVKMPSITAKKGVFLAWVLMLIWLKRKTAARLAQRQFTGKCDKDKQNCDGEGRQ
jgi:hypothetical protein